MVRSEKDLCCLQLIAGHLALDFANSIWRRESAQPCEILKTYGLLVEWSRLAGVLSDEQSNILASEGADRGSEAVAVLERALALRGAIYDLFSSFAAGSRPDPQALAVLNSEVASALCRRQIEWVGDDYRWVWRGSETALDRMLWPISDAAAALLASDERTRVRQCQAQDCDRLFLEGRGGPRRRWCSMEWCGNREKARRSLARKRSHR